MSKVSFDWHGDELADRVERAAREAVNETVDDARDDAKATHPWKVDPELRRLRKGGRLVNPNLEGQIVSEHAEVGPNPTAAFGTTRRKGFYGLFHELSTVHEHAFPFLRPAADRAFPTLAARIKEKLK
jgi:hypothetical protein